VGSTVVLLFTLIPAQVNRLAQTQRVERDVVAGLKPATTLE